MDKAMGVWEGVAQSARHHHTLWTGALYALTIVAVLAVVAKLY